MPTSNDPHNDPADKLLAKAFGNLDKRPFAWCFAPPQEGDQGYVSLDQLFFILSKGAIGSPPPDWPWTPPTPEKPQQQKKQKRAPQH
jgi:hypothetical protein